MNAAELAKATQKTLKKRWQKCIEEITKKSQQMDKMNVSKNNPKNNSKLSKIKDEIRSLQKEATKIATEMGQKERREMASDGVKSKVSSLMEKAARTGSNAAKITKQAKNRAGVSKKSVADEKHSMDTEQVERSENALKSLKEKLAKDKEKMRAAKTNDDKLDIKRVIQRTEEQVTRISKNLVKIKERISKHKAKKGEKAEEASSVGRLMEKAGMETARPRVRGASAAKRANAGIRTHNQEVRIEEQKDDIRVFRAHLKEGKLSKEQQRKLHEDIKEAQQTIKRLQNGLKRASTRKPAGAARSRRKKVGRKREHSSLASLMEKAGMEKASDRPQRLEGEIDGSPDEGIAAFRRLAAQAIKSVQQVADSSRPAAPNSATMSAQVSGKVVLVKDAPRKPTGKYAYALRIGEGLPLAVKQKIVETIVTDFGCPKPNGNFMTANITCYDEDDEDEEVTSTLVIGYDVGTNFSTLGIFKL